MPRPMLRTPQTQTHSDSLLSATQNTQQKQQTQQIDGQQKMRRPRAHGEHDIQAQHRISKKLLQAAAVDLSRKQRDDRCQHEIERDRQRR